MAAKLERNLERARVLKTKLSFDEKNYEYNDKFVPSDLNSALDVHTVHELVSYLEKDKKAEIDARVQNRDGSFRRISNREGFLKTWKQNEKRFMESGDSFLYDYGTSSSVGGSDFTPVLGGPFNKQLYIYDYLRMNQLSFYAYHHDPIARRAVEIIRDFTLGRGFRIDCENQSAQALISAFEEVNDLQNFMNYFAIELATYGEVMPWELPDNQTKIQFGVSPSQEASKAPIPRYRLIDPSCIWEIVTFPEDITRVLNYTWVAPTQYQIYGGKSGGEQVSNFKFIFQQIPAEQVLHYKINCMSNEKRGRSDLFPALGYMKRLRDSVDYSLIALQKQAAWAIDTTIEGSQADIDAYAAAQESMGTIAPAGSEFIHTKKVTRQFLSNSAGKGGQSEAFEWALSMIASATGIPLQYFGTHLSNSGTRASALVSTEPVTKKFEMRQKIYEKALRDMVKRLFKKFGVASSTEFEITFPEIVTEDRSSKLKDLQAAQANGWISRERAAEIAAKELGVTKFEYKKEQEKIEIESQDSFAAASSVAPLSAPAEEPDTHGLSSEEKKGIKDDLLTL